MGVAEDVGDAVVSGVEVEVGIPVAVGDAGGFVDVGVDTCVAVGTGVALGVNVGVCGIGVETGTAVGDASIVAVNVGVSVTVGGGRVAVTVADGVATRVGDDNTTVGDGDEVGIIVGVGKLSSRTQPAITTAATIPNTTTSATPNAFDLTQASNRRTCNQLLSPSPATLKAT